MNLLETRLVDLKQELERGQRQLDHLDNQRRETRDTLLRIGGAIQVLEELLREQEHHSTDPVFQVNGTVPVTAR